MSLAVLARAQQYSAMRHINQRRKDASGAPYINHPLDLVAILADEAEITDTVILAAAVLHDVIEDTGEWAARYQLAEDLVVLFGQDVVNVVWELTDDKCLDKAVRKQLQIDNAAKKSKRAKAASLADKTANIRDLLKSAPVGWSVERVDAYFVWAKAVVDNMRGDWPKLEALFDQAHQAYTERKSSGTAVL